MVGTTPPSPVRIDNVAFESVTCAANSLSINRKTIRNYIDKFSEVEFLTLKQWEDWTDKKVMNFLYF